jgi:hypothetical protein
VRWYLPGNESINCGLYDREMAAVVRERLLAEVAHHPLTALGIWKALTVVLGALETAGAKVPRVLPKYVKARPDGVYSASVRKGGRFLEAPGPFDTPEEAHLEMCELIAREFPAAVRVTDTPVRETGELVTLLDYFRPTARAVRTSGGRAR